MEGRTMDRFEAMSILLTAVDAGSLSAAGRKLHMPLATVSRKISDLETHLKTRLLLRGGRTLVLTDAGRSYVASCRRIVEDVNEAERTASGEYQAPTGELVVSTPLVFGRTHVLPVATEFLKIFPDIKVRLLLNDRVVNMLDEHIDLSVRIGTLPDSSLIATRVGLTRLTLFASPAYLAARGTPHTPQDLTEHETIFFEILGAASDHWEFERDGLRISAPIRPRLRANTAEAVRDAAISGLGIGRIMSYSVSQPVADGALRLLLREYELAPVPISMVYPSQRLLPLKLRAFLDFAVPRLRERLETGELVPSVLGTP
jgi:DNA-binding transcriptional LysR family regulator